MVVSKLLSLQTLLIQSSLHTCASLSAEWTSGSGIAGSKDLCI